MPVRSILLAPLLGSVAVLPHPVLASSPALPSETLQQSIQRLEAFPFLPNCNGNTQEVVACLWHRRNQADQRLLKLMDAGTLEPWRASRRRVCEGVAAKAEGGTLLPIVWFSCENALNQTLLKQGTTPLGR